MEVFILVTEYVKLVGGGNDGSFSTVKEKEINAVYNSQYEAEKMGKWLLEQEEYNGIKYTDYKIENFIII